MFHTKVAEGQWRRVLLVAGILALVPGLLSAGLLQVASPQPPVRIPSEVAWTDDTIALVNSGNAVRGLVLARRCERCHGVEGFSSTPMIPNIAAMDKLSMWKQLDDFRSGKRKSSLMQPIAAALTLHQSADVAAYFAIVPNTPDPQDPRSFPQPNSNVSSARIAIPLITLGDGRRGVPPCQACHGPVAYVKGAPPLATQNGPYILNQLNAFSDWSRANDINLRMRSIASQLTPQEKQALSDYYGAGYAYQPPAE